MSSKLQPVLANETVHIRPLVQDDFEALFRVASDPLIWEQHQNSDRHTLAKFTEFFDQGIAGKAAFAILDKKSNKIIGSSRYRVISEIEGVIEIGWSFLGRSFWGGAYNKEFKKLLINHALQFYKHVVFYVHINNYRSQGAMLKIGGRKMKEDSTSWVRSTNDTLTYVIDHALH